jgi:drug/metabolite transporter (DMT)-like permease
MEKPTWNPLLRDGSPRKSLALLAMTATTLIWGLTFVSIKIAVSVLPPMTLAATRFVVASVLLQVVFRKREPEARFRKADLPLLLVGGLFGITLYFFFQNTGVRLISASEAAIIVAAIPVIIMMVNTLVYKDPLTFVMIGGVLVSVAGVYLVVMHGLSYGDSSSTGYLCMFGAVIAWVVYNFLTKPLLGRYTKLAIVSRQMIFGTLALLPFVFLEIESIEWQRITPAILMHVLFLGLFGSAMGYTLYIYALNHLGVVATSMFINLVPVVAAVSGAIVLGELLALTQIVGGLMVILSVSVVSLANRR